MKQYKYLKNIQWNLDASFLKEMENKNDEHGKTIVVGNH
jgi:hypothetical protein